MIDEAEHMRIAAALAEKAGMHRTARALVDMAEARDQRIEQIGRTLCQEFLAMRRGWVAPAQIPALSDNPLQKQPPLGVVQPS